VHREAGGDDWAEELGVKVMFVEVGGLEGCQWDWISFSHVLVLVLVFVLGVQRCRIKAFFSCFCPFSEL